MRKLFFLFLIPALVLAQQYYEASGQTQVFKLTAGAKAGGSGILTRSRIAKTASPRMLVTTQNGIRIGISGVQGQGRISIYNLAGKRLQITEIAGNASVVLGSDISTGVYIARLEVNGHLAQSTRFWKAR